MDTIGGQCGTGSRCDATNAAVIILKKKSTHRYSLFKVITKEEASRQPFK